MMAYTRFSLLALIVVVSQANSLASPPGVDNKKLLLLNFRMRYLEPYANPRFPVRSIPIIVVIDISHSFLPLQLPRVLHKFLMLPFIESLLRQGNHGCIHDCLHILPVHICCHSETADGDALRRWRFTDTNLQLALRKYYIIKSNKLTFFHAA